MTKVRTVPCASRVTPLATRTRRRLPPAVALAGDGAVVRDLRTALGALGDLDLPIVLIGEPGVGKRACAETLHRGAAPDACPLQVLEPDAPELVHLDHVLEDLTAHAASSGRTGRPTIYLESIERIPLPVQERIVATLARAHPVRVVASAPTLLAELVGLGCVDRRLSDAFSRVTLHVPALRDRFGDVAAIARALEPAVTIDPTVPDVLVGYGWPGNVLELVETLERARVLVSGARVTAPAVRRVLGNRPRRSRGFDIMRLDDFEYRYLRRVVARFSGNQSHAALHLGISRNTLARKLREPMPSPPLVAKRA